MQVAQALMESSCKGASPSASEKMYANIQRELLTIVWGAQKFHTGVQAQSYCPDRSQTARVNLSKPVNEAPPRLQRMLLKLIKYDLEVR